MKKKIINFCMNEIKKKFLDYSEEKLEIIEYGLEGFYLTMTKIIIIFLLGFILGKIKNILMLLLSYNVIRFFAFGLHAKKSYQCLVLSLLLFIGGVYACDYLYIPLELKGITLIILIFLIYMYAPADTEKRPLVNKKKRKRYKVYSVLISLIYSILIILFNDSIVSNYLLFGLALETLMILPISYKILKLPYCNYKEYQKKLV